MLFFVCLFVYYAFVILLLILHSKIILSQFTSVSIIGFLLLFLTLHYLRFAISVCVYVNVPSYHLATKFLIKSRIHFKDIIPMVMNIRQLIFAEISFSLLISCIFMCVCLYVCVNGCGVNMDRILRKEFFFLARDQSKNPNTTLFLYISFCKQINEHILCIHIHVLYIRGYICT